AEAAAPVVVGALHLVAFRHRAVDRPVVEAAAAEHALRPVAGGRAAALRDGPHVFDVRVLAPLPDVPGHVEQAELVRRLPGDSCMWSPPLRSCPATRSMWIVLPPVEVTTCVQPLVGASPGGFRNCVGMVGVLYR